MVLWRNEKQFVFPVRMMTMLIRAATLDDAPAMSDLIRPLASAHITPDFSPAGAANLLASMAPEALVRYFHAGYVYHAAEVDGNIVGVVGMRDNSHLFHLFVSDDFRGRGFARELWRAPHAAKTATQEISPSTRPSSPSACIASLALSKPARPSP